MRFLAGSACFPNSRCMLHPPKQVFGPVINRISDVMAHLDRYAFHGCRRLAIDARVSASSVSRLIHGKQNPSMCMASRIAAALEREVGRPIDARELLAESGHFPTRFVCDLVGCRGCLPPNAYDEFGDLKPTFDGIAPGTWICSRFPRGFNAGKEAHV